MKLIDFLIDLKPIDRTTEKDIDNYQTIVAFSVSKNSFLILADFITKYNDKCQDSVSIENAYFKIHNLSNDLNYCTIEKITFKEDDDGFPAFYICLKVDTTPDFSAHKKKAGDKLPKEIKLNGKSKFRFHLDFSEKCGQGPSNSGDWPCNTVKIV